MASNNEWIIHDAESLRKALDAAKRKRKFSLEDLKRRMGGHLLNRILRGEKADITASTLIKAANAMGMELVLREPQTSKTQQRLEALRKATEAKARELLTEVVTEQLIPTDRDEQGKLTRPLTEMELAEVDATVARYLAIGDSYRSK